jgi:phosphoribosylformylglycinamidine cyclo-ligase
MASSGLHSNGYSLVRAVVRHAGWQLDRHVEEFGRTLGEELLEPTRVYASDVLALARDEDAQVHAVTHVTGGGLAANLARVLPEGTVATVDRASWEVPPVFRVVRELGGVPRGDLENTLNLGVGMVAVVGADGAEAALARLERLGVPAWTLGTVDVLDDAAAGENLVTGTKGVRGGAVRLVHDYR